MSKVPVNENGSHADARTAAGANGRAADGKFAAGNACGKGNPFGRRLAAMRQAVLDAVSEDDVQEIMAMLVRRAKEGDVAAAKLVLQYAVGKPAPAPEPDRVEIDEWKLRQQGGVANDDFMTTFGRATAELANDLIGTIQPAMHRKMFAEFADNLSKSAPPPHGDPAPHGEAGTHDAPSRNGSNGAHRRRPKGRETTN